MSAPPHDELAEQSVLGVLLTKPTGWINIDQRDSWSDLQGLLSADDFFDARHRFAFEAFGEIFARGDIPDVRQVASVLKQRERAWEDVGGYLSRCTDNCSPTSLMAYALAVQRTSRQRRALALAQALAVEARGDVGDLDEWAANAAKAFDAIATGGATTVDYRPIRDVMIESESNRREAERTGVPPKRFPSGLADLDAKVTFRPGQLVVVGAAAGVGKTSLIGGLTRSFANFYGWHEHAQRSFPGEVPHVLLAAMEMTDTEMGDRLLFGAAKVSKQKLDRGQLTDDEIQQVVGAADPVAQLPIFLMAKPGIRLADLRRNIRALARESQDTRYPDKRRGKLRVVVIDYLTLMKLEGRKGATRSEIVGETVREMKVLAMEEELCVVLVSQINRAYSGRKDPRPIMADLRDSGEIEQHADIILFAYRDEVHNPETKLRDFGEVIVAKQRNGQASTRVYLRWKGEYTMFEDMTYEDRINLANAIGGGHE